MSQDLEEDIYLDCPSSPFLDTSDIICHELRTPLTAIQGVLKLLKHQQFGTLSEEGQHLLDMAERNATRLTRLANSIDHQSSSIGSLISVAEIETLKLENDLFSGFNQQEFFLHYQPIISTAENHQIIGFEALARWQHPFKGLISPDIFIPLAERVGLIQQLGLDWLQQACEQLKYWQQEFPSDPPLTINVNLSTAQLSSHDFSHQVEKIIDATGIAPNTLKLEVTESALIENQDVALETFIDLQRIGVQIYVDDFGTGYSSLSRLQDLPFDALKIDQSFIRSQNWTISEAILLLASRLGLDVVAEGIETPKELYKLTSLGCEKMQGYLFSKPVTSQEASQLLEGDAKISFFLQ
jgi:EAL domain-containing protein (putative c-di-GMP-specific phosphodiesterase class I)